MTTNLMEPSVFQHSIFSPQHRAQNPVASNYLEPHTLNPNLKPKTETQTEFFFLGILIQQLMFSIGGACCFPQMNTTKTMVSPPAGCETVVSLNISFSET